MKFCVEGRLTIGTGEKTETFFNGMTLFLPWRSNLKVFWFPFLGEQEQLSNKSEQIVPFKTLAVSVWYIEPRNMPAESRWAYQYPITHHLQWDVFLFFICPTILKNIIKGICIQISIMGLRHGFHIVLSPSKIPIWVLETILMLIWELPDVIGWRLVRLLIYA